jgi:hypothetical protein
MLQMSLSSTIHYIGLLGSLRCETLMKHVHNRELLTNTLFSHRSTIIDLLRDLHYRTPDPILESQRPRVCGSL